MNPYLRALLDGFWQAMETARNALLVIALAGIVMVLVEACR